MQVLNVSVKPNSRRESVTQHNASTFTIQVSASPLKGKANKAMLKLLAKHLNVLQNQLMITAGESYNEKIVLLIDEDQIA